MTDGPVSFLVRHRITYAKHLEAFAAWTRSHDERIRRELPELRAIRRYRHEKDPLFLHTFYDFAPDATWGPALDTACRRVRDGWLDVGPNVRELTGVAYVEVWCGRDPAWSEDPAGSRPLIAERFAFTPYHAGLEAEWARWYDGEMLPEMVRSLPVLAITRHRAVEGSPRYQLKVNEYADEATMKGSVARDAAPGARAGDDTRTSFGQGWARFLPYADDLTRWVLLPGIA